LAADLVGWHGGPGVAKKTGGDEPGTGAFAVQLDTNKNIVLVGHGGRYYVDGLLIEERSSLVEAIKAEASLANKIVFLDAWERHAPTTADPVQPDPVFGGLETSTRVKLEVRVKVLRTAIAKTDVGLTSDDGFRKLKVQQGPSANASDPQIDPRPLNDQDLLPTLAAWTRLPAEATDEYCDPGAAGGYTGLENQLFRVEIQQGGALLWDGVRTTDGQPGSASAPTGGFPRIDPAHPPVTFKYSLDNGSIVYPVKDLSTGSTNSLTLAAAWRDESRSIKPGNWIEILKDDEDTGVLVLVRDVQKSNDGVKIKFTFQPESAPASAATNIPTLPDGTKAAVIVRRWDHHARKDFPQYQGGIVVPGTLKGGVWTSSEIPLQDGIWIRLKLPANAEFRQGDYWTIPARAALQDILWGPADESQAGTDRYARVPARYARHDYAPIAFIEGQNPPVDLRRKISPIAT
jgi:hypothetical protein